MVRPSRRSAHVVFIALCAVLGFAACGISIPEDKQLYIGHWNNPEVSLRIDSNGAVAYERSGSIGRTTINGPIQEFRGDDFVVGLRMNASKSTGRADHSIHRPGLSFLTIRPTSRSDCDAKKGGWLHCGGLDSDPIFLDFPVHRN